MERPSRKTHVLHVRLNAAEHAGIVEFCEANGLSTSEVLRRGARLAAGLGPTFDGKTRDRLVDAARQLHGIATNVNQMAKAMNSGRVPPQAELAAGFGRLIAQLRAIEEDYLSLCSQGRAAVASEGTAP